MNCRTVAAGPGFTAIVCSRGVRRKRCSTNGCVGTEVALCDYPLSGRKAGKTCDRSMCARCRHAQGPDVDYCPVHANQKTLEIIGGAR